MVRLSGLEEAKVRGFGDSDCEKGDTAISRTRRHLDVAFKAQPLFAAFNDYEALLKSRSNHYTKITEW